MCGIDDFRHQIWPTSFIICNTESGHKARKIFVCMVDLINADLRGSIDKSLIDGAQALRSAYVDLGVDPRNFFHARYPFAVDKRWRESRVIGIIC